MKRTWKQLDTIKSVTYIDYNINYNLNRFWQHFVTNPEAVCQKKHKYRIYSSWYSARNGQRWFQAESDSSDFAWNDSLHFQAESTIYPLNSVSRTSGTGYPILSHYMIQDEVNRHSALTLITRSFSKIRVQ